MTKSIILNGVNPCNLKSAKLLALRPTFANIKPDKAIAPPVTDTAAMT